MPCIMKSTLHEPPLGPCLDIEKNKYENPPSSSPPFIFVQTPLLEEFVCLGGLGLPETVELLLPLTILPTGTGFSIGFSEETETSLSREESTIKVLDNSMKPPKFSEEASQESGMQLVLVPQDVGNPDLWNQRKFETFSNFLGFPTIGI